MKCSVAECDMQARGRGLCTKHYLSYRRKGCLPKKLPYSREVRDAKERFDALFVRRGIDECWEWQGVRTKQGYGRFTKENGKYPISAHRYAYEMAHGKIPAGLCVCHSCDNPRCVNPSHLWLGTVAQNNEDKLNKGRNIAPNQQGENHSQHILSAEQVIEIRSRVSSGEKQNAIAIEFGVAKNTIHKIVTFKTWSHIGV